MFHRLPALLPPDTARALGTALAALPTTAWEAGRASAGSQAAAVKHNLQLPRSHPLARQAQTAIEQALEASPAFLSAALPRRLFPPRINRYESEHSHFGWHVDGAIRRHPDTGTTLRTDLSCTVFLSDPQDYDGGVLEIQDGDATHSIKWAAGDAVLYPANTVHQVTPVTRGCRVACFLWIESLVADDADRRLLHQLDTHLTTLRGACGDQEATVGLMAVYHHLLRKWSVT